MGEQADHAAQAGVDPLNEPTMTLTDDHTGYSIKCRPVYSTEICKEVILTFETVEEASKVFHSYGDVLAGKRPG